MKTHPKSFKSKSYPEIIRKNIFIKKNSKPYKIFPELGLKNKETLIQNSPRLSICFSSHPWDIATMSMRGIESCMGWNEEYPESLVGSILDPYTAIIYITNHTESSSGYGYGANIKLSGYKSMIARAVVRLVTDTRKVSGQDNVPYIFMEKIYTNSSFSKAAFNAENVFSEYISDNLNSKLKVVSRVIGLSPYPVTPTSKITEQIIKSGRDWYLTYSDAELHYQKVNVFYQPKKAAKHILKHYKK